jgi:hypothetical protein
MKKIMWFFLFITIIIGCESNTDTKLSLKNKSYKEIYVKLSSNKSDIAYFIKNHEDTWWENFGHYLLPDSSACFPAWNTWETFIQDFEDKKVHFFVFDADTFRGFRAGSINKNQIRYKQLDFTAEELKKINWEVVYKDSI